MNRKQLAQHVAWKLNLAGHKTNDKTVESTIAQLISTIKEVTENGEVVSLKLFGTFHKVKRKPRLGMNPSTGGRMQIPAKDVLQFKSNTTFKEYPL